MVVFLCGCVTPVKRTFPEPPKYVEKCSDLEQIKDNVTLSEIAKVITQNYSSYYECALKNDTWNEWYQTQKRIFESVK